MKRMPFTPDRFIYQCNTPEATLDRVLDIPESDLVAIRFKLSTLTTNRPSYSHIAFNRSWVSKGPEGVQLDPDTNGFAVCWESPRDSSSGQISDLSWGVEGENNLTILKSEQGLPLLHLFHAIKPKTLTYIRREEAAERFMARHSDMSNRTKIGSFVSSLASGCAYEDFLELYAEELFPENSGLRTYPLYRPEAENPDKDMIDLKEVSSFITGETAISLMNIQS